MQKLADRRIGHTSPREIFAYILQHSSRKSYSSSDYTHGQCTTAKSHCSTRIRHHRRRRTSTRRTSPVECRTRREVLPTLKLANSLRISQVQSMQHRSRSRGIVRAEVDREVRRRRRTSADRLPELCIVVAVEQETRRRDAEGCKRVNFHVRSSGGFVVDSDCLDDVGACDVVGARAAGDPGVVGEGGAADGRHGIVGGAGPGQVGVIANDGEDLSVGVWNREENGVSAGFITCGTAIGTTSWEAAVGSWDGDVLGRDGESACEEEKCSLHLERLTDGKLTETDERHVSEQSLTFTNWAADDL